MSQQRLPEIRLPVRTWEPVLSPAKREKTVIVSEFTVMFNGDLTRDGPNNQPHLAMGNSPANTRLRCRSAICRALWMTLLNFSSAPFPTRLYLLRMFVRSAGCGLPIYNRQPFNARNSKLLCRSGQSQTIIASTLSPDRAAEELKILILRCNIALPLAFRIGA